MLWAMRATYSFQFMQVVVPALVALVVVALTHLFSIYRDRENKRREQRIAYLVSVFRTLSKANQHPRIYEIADELEQAVTDLQLFGTPDQVDLAKKFALDLGNTRHAEIESLLNELRDSLRKELGRKPVSGHVVSLRVTRK